MTKEQIKELRTKLGMTQKEFADKVGTTIQTISNWENGVFEPLPVYQKKLERLAQNA